MNETGILLGKAATIGVLIAFGETLNGIFRVRVLNRRLGDRGARRVAVLTGSALIFLIGWLTLGWVGPSNDGESWAVGACWLLLMLGFDIGFGRWVFRASWKRIAADFDVRQGNLLAVGMMVLTLTPWIVAKLRDLY